MHNWWIASLEHFGLITREEAEHIASNIKNTIHKDNYVEAYRELEAILGSAKFDSSTVLQKLSDRLNQVEAEMKDLKNKKAPAVPPPATKTAPELPAPETGKPAVTGVEKTLANATKA